MVIQQTKKWIETVVVGCNFCPFATHVIQRDAVHYTVQSSKLAATCFGTLSGEIDRLSSDSSIETSFLIFPNAVPVFEDYLELVTVAEKWMKQKKFDGVYQLASFHPLYLFANSETDDAANYTNRAIYPMLHLLRESSIDKALRHYKDAQNIPAHNIDFARKKGVVYMKMLRDACLGAG